MGARYMQVQLYKSVKEGPHRELYQPYLKILLKTLAFYMIHKTIWLVVYYLYTITLLNCQKIFNDT